MAPTTARTDAKPNLRGGRVLSTEIPLPRIARQGAVCLVSVRGPARKDRIEKCELDEGFRPFHHTFRKLLRKQHAFAKVMPR